MNPYSNALSRKSALFLYALATIPVLGVFCIYFFYSIAILKFAVIGGAAIVLASIFFAFPKFSLYVAIFYVYAGLTYYFQFHAAYPIVVIAFFAVLLRHFLGHPIEMRDRMFNWSVAVFTLIALTSMLYARSIDTSLFGFLKYLKALVLAFLTLQLLRKPADLEKYALVIYFGGVMTVLFGLVNLQFGLARDLTVTGYGQINRFAGTHINPNTLAIYLASALPLSFYVVKRVHRPPVRVLAALGSFAIILAILASYSRAAVFPLVFTLIATMIREVKSKNVYLGIVLLLFVVILITPPYYWERVLTIGAVIEDLSSDWSLYMRMEAAKAAIKLFMQNPLTGIGLNNVLARSASYLYIPLVAHNAYLEILAGLGVFGFIAWLCIFLSSIRGCLRGMKHRWDSSTIWMKDLSFYMLLSFISALMNALFLSEQFGYHIWLPLAGGLVAGEMVRRHAGTQTQQT
jgi:O-antigen ligase